MYNRTLLLSKEI